ncbi:MAG: DUF87 domain-containing protein [Actinomycetia bacterium]|nr:DUF87 domain-containing protein [Actinomycetes bacterium]
MIINIPANYRVPMTWLGSLDAAASVSVAGGAMLALKALVGPAPWALKIPEILVAGGLGLAGGLVRWPAEPTGDRLPTWARRAWAFAARPRLGAGAAPGGRSAWQRFVGVDALAGSLVRRPDGTWVAVLEVAGETLKARFEAEQAQRLAAFAAALNGIPDGWTVQITVLTEPVDLTAYQARLDATGGSEAFRRVVAAQQDLAAELAAQGEQAVTLLSVAAPSETEAQSRAAQLAHLLGGRFAVRFGDPERLAALLARAFGQSPVSPAAVLGTPLGVLRRARGPTPAPPPAGRLRDRIRRAAPAPPPEPDLAARLPGPADVVGPGGFAEQPQALLVDGRTAVTLAVRAWPSRGFPGWFDPILTFRAPGVARRVSLHLTPLNTAAVLHEFNRKLADLDSNARWAARRGLRPDERTELALGELETLRLQLARGDERMWDVAALVTLLGDTPEAAFAAARELAQRAAGMSVVLRPLWLQQGPGFQATLPLAWRPGDLPVTPLPTSAVASLYPFAGGDLIQPDGDLWGRNPDTGNPVLVDPRAVRPVAHQVVLGMPGSGKSFAVKVLATQALFDPQTDVLVLDPSDPIDYGRWTALADGTFARFGVGGTDRLNPGDLWVPADLATLEADLARPVTAKVAFLALLLELMAYPDGAMPPAERAALERALYGLYAAWGFADDWASVLDPQPSLTPRARPAPTLADVLAALEADPALRELAARCAPFVRGTLDMFSGRTTVDLDRRVVVFNVGDLSQGGRAQHLQAVAYALIADAIRGRLAQRGRRTLIVVDEAHVFFKRPDTAALLDSVSRMARKLGGRLCLVTHKITDLLGDPTTGRTVAGAEAASAVLANAGVALLMRTAIGVELDLLAQTFQLTPAERQFVQDAPAGQGLLIVGQERGTRRVPVEILATDALYPFITTRPEEVAALAAALGATPSPAPEPEEEGQPDDPTPPDAADGIRPADAARVRRARRAARR